MSESRALQSRHDLMNPAEARCAVRSGVITGNTAGMAPGFIQGNLVILPGDLAFDFMRFCQRNPKPCPIVSVSDIGNPALPDLGNDIDIRSDIPSYNVYRGGELTETLTDINQLWRDDFVTFIIGCSYSFEQALVNEGVALRHLEEGLTVSMYKTNLETTPAGRFCGGMVVSMRPLTPSNAIRAVEITSRFPHTHGTPVHLGDPAQIGINDISKPDWGDGQLIKKDEIPVFWACGVTPQNVLQNACPEIFITHKPGSMLITDLPSAR